MKGTTNAQRNAIVDSASAVDSLTLTKADGTTQKHTVSNIIPKDDAPTSGSSKFVTSGAIYTALNGKVSVVSGKGLSTNDYTTAEKSKVSNLPDNANNTFATKTELTSAVSSVYKYKGTKAAYANLPSSGNTTGDVWNVTAAYGNVPAGTNWAWNGSAWDALGGEIDLSGYVPTSRTVNGKALTGNITLSASDVGALASGGTAAKATADASGNNIVNTYATKTEVTNGLAGKQNALTFDSAPTSGSSNPVTSGGVYSAINTKVPASGTYDADTSTITFKAASGTQLFQVTGIEGGGAQFTLKITYAGAPDVSGISVTATPVTGATATVQGTTNSSGIAYLSVKQNATYKVTSSKTGYTFTSEPEVSCTDLTTEASISCYVPGTVTVTVTDEKTSVVGRAVTATASGQTTQTKTISSGNSVTFSLPAGTWTFKSDYPSGATGSTSFTQVVENNGTYSGTISIVYNIVYGVRIAVGTSGPKARVSYPSTIFSQTNAAASFAKGTGPNNLGGWAGCALISGIKRQTVSSSKVNPSESDFTDVADKRSAVAGSSSTDVVTYFPTWWVKMTNDGTNIDFAFSMEQIDDTWKDYAGSVGTNRVGHFRLGCFCSPVSSAVKSYGGTKSATISLTNAITYTQTNRGAGFDLMTWYQWTYIAMLMTAIFGTTDLQSVLGNGVSSGSQSSQTALSFSNDYGMYGSTSDKTSQMAFFWLQNIYGDYWQWVGGAHTNSNRQLETNTGYSSTSSWDKTGLSTTLSSSLNGAIDRVVGTTDAGFFPASTAGSYTTYFADSGGVGSSCFPVVGGRYNDGTYCGAFCARFDSNTSYTDAVRLSYRL